MSLTAGSLANLIGFNNRSDIVLLDRQSAYSAHDLLLQAESCARLFADASGGRILVPTGNPAAAIIGLLACKLAACVAVLWREDALPRDELAELTGAKGLLEYDPATASGRVVELVTSRSGQSAPGDMIIPTSGSTGKPKGVALDLEQAVTNAALAGSCIEWDGIDAWSTDGDLSTISALSHVLMAWRYRKQLVHLKGLDWSAKQALFQRFRAGYGGAPLQLREISQRLAQTPPAVMVSSGDFLRPALAVAIQARLPRTLIHSMYGLTECAGRFCVLPHDVRRERPAAAGRPMPGFAATVMPDEQGGEGGEICIRSPLLFYGYWRSREGFVARRSGDFHTGDRGIVDESGHVTLLGRSNDVFKVGGEKVDRQTIETVLHDMMPDTELCVLPVPHDVFGLVPALFIGAPGNGNLPSRADITAAIRSRLPTRYVPAYFLQVEGNLPRLASGKLDRAMLICDYASMRDYRNPAPSRDRESE